MTDADDTEAVEERLDDLEATVGELREEVRVAVHRDIPLLKGTVRAMIDGEIETPEDFPAAGRGFAARVAEIETTATRVETRLDELGDVTTAASTKEEKFAAILAFARKKRNDSPKVAVSPDEIRGCVGVSRRYAYELIEAMGEAIDGVQVREAKQIETSSGTKRKGKALLVDCEAVHAGDGTVKKFTTGGGESEGH